MACPVLGEKSIIHRLRSLAMSDLSPRRRLAGRALLGAGLLALPLTASISYAAGEIAPDAPELPAPPAPPSDPAAKIEVPETPEVPDIAAAPQPVEPKAATAGDNVTEHVWRDSDGNEKSVRMVFRAAPKGEVLSLDHQADREEVAATLAEMLARHDLLRAELDQRTLRWLAEAEAAYKAGTPHVMVLKGCTSAFPAKAQAFTGEDGRQTIMICQPRIPTTARLGLEQARAEIAADKDIPEETRQQLLETLDRQIARWKEREG